ncbi:hypothetical protein AK812_SmicGene27018 [Symbiodinium microadriaticum]|uniref:Uncharacterized protein n=1 Tax=Symbiodinium microadriaticum TaxID=2951 RepID=A0A1Q9D823_SYMMI|nr:hypothetical protein AK812_SmicGene27018 [Symbiodinium microadriaticum]
MQHYVARLYRCVLFDVGALRVHGEGGLWGPCSAGALHSASELLARDKRVGVLSGSPLRAKVIKAATCEGGLPAEVAAWTSGELICRSLEGSLDHEVISALPKPPKAYTPVSSRVERRKPQELTPQPGLGLLLWQDIGLQRLRGED